MDFKIKMIGLIVVFILTFIMGRKVRCWIPLGNEFRVGSFNAVGILLVVFIILDFIFPELKNSFISIAISGLVFGFASNTSNKA
ncbi:MAG: hypothetical protein GX295_01585 [Syntrophomonadaceae bacterium]|nr:hypothetical protein [Syntrophomonadaceae bacterium]